MARFSHALLEEGPGIIGLLLVLLGDDEELDVLVLLDVPPGEGVPAPEPVDLVVGAQAEQVVARTHDAGAHNGEEGDQLRRRETQEDC